MALTVGQAAAVIALGGRAVAFIGHVISLSVKVSAHSGDYAKRISDPSRGQLRPGHV
jgi:hypothetical protein